MNRDGKADEEVTALDDEYVYESPEMTQLRLLSETKAKLQSCGE